MLKREIAEGLGISPAMVTKLVKRGMPIDSLERAQRWRRRHLEPGRVKGVRYESKPPDRIEPVTDASAAGALALPNMGEQAQALTRANALMEAASLVLDAGGSIETLVPALRAALAAIPAHERDAVGLYVSVMNVLVAHVLALAPPEDEDLCSAPMTDEDAQEVGEFWYSVAAGEWQLTTPAPPRTLLE